MGFVPLNIMVFITCMVTWYGRNFSGRYHSAGEHIMLHIYPQLAIVAVAVPSAGWLFPSQKSDQVMYHVCASRILLSVFCSLCFTPLDLCLMISMSSNSSFLISYIPFLLLYLITVVHSLRMVSYPNWLYLKLETVYINIRNKFEIHQHKAL